AAPLLGGYGRACDRKRSLGFEVRNTLDMDPIGARNSPGRWAIGLRVTPAIGAAMPGTSARPTARSRAGHGHAGVPSTLAGRRRRAGFRPDPAHRGPAGPRPRGGARRAATRPPVPRTPSWADSRAPAARGGTAPGGAAISPAARES